MHRSAAAILAIVAVTVSACSSVTSGSGSRAALAPGPAGSSAASGASLQSQLLTLHDMPSGWQPDDSSDLSSPDAPACLRNASSSIPSKGSATTGFSAADGLPALFEVLGQFGTSANARQAYAAVQTLVDGCGSFEITSGGTSLHGSLTRTTLPTVGDESSAWRLTIGASSGTVGSGAFLLARRGTELLVLLYASLGGSDAQEVLPYARLAVARMPR